MENPDHSVLFIMNGIGDSILAFPALRALCHVLKGNVKLLTSGSRYSDLFNSLPVLDIVRVEHHYEAGVGRQFDASAAAAQLGQACNYFINLNPWHSPSVSSLLGELRCTKTIGYNSTFDYEIPLDFTKHSSELAFDVVLAIDPSLRFDDFCEPLVFPAKYEGYAQKILSQLPSEAKLLCVQHDTAPEKCWDLESMRWVVRAFLFSHPEYFCFVVGQQRLFDEHEEAHAVVELEGRSLLFSQCVVAHADLFLGIDSCMLHVADICRVPSVGVFGPTNPTEFGSRLAKNITVRGTDRCQGIAPERVLEALDKLCVC